jgi:glutaredoxin
MIKRSGQQGVPQMWINNAPVIGFDKNRIDRMLAIK